MSYTSKLGHQRHSKCLMAVSLSINNKMTCIINGYAPAKGCTRVSEWMFKSVLPAVAECQRHRWEVVIGGDFNAVPSPMDCGHPDRYKECCALRHLLSNEGGLIDSFRAVHPSRTEFSWTKLIKHKYTGTRQGLEALDGASLDLIMSFLPTIDRARVSGASWVFYERYHRVVIQQKHIDLILVSAGTEIATAHIAHDLAIESDHAPALLSIHLTRVNAPGAVLKHKSATRQFSSSQLDYAATRSKFLERVRSLLAACNHGTQTGRAQSVCDAVAKAAAEVLYPVGHKKEGVAVGIARRYSHKAIKVVNYVKRCLAQGGSVPVTRNMRQLAEAPDWVRCPLPLAGGEAPGVHYLHAATAAKKKAHRHLDWMRLLQDQEGGDALVRYSALGTPKALARFWQKLRHQGSNTVTLSATTVTDGVATTYHNANAILAVFQRYWASLYSATANPRSVPRPWFHARRPPIPADKLAALTTPITEEEFAAAL